jgi:ribosomal protein S18 acetylase RimI-like enzyme
MSVEIIERDVTKSELERMKAGFVEHDLEFGIQPHTQIRYGVVAMDGDKFIGCASGLMDRNWFFLSDLWLEKEYRGRGTGTRLLQMLEAKVFELGIARIYTWTAGFEAPLFYKRQGYEIFGELDDYYPMGHSRIGLKKVLRERAARVSA